MFGAFGFLALGMVAYMLQLSIDPERWDGSWLRASFWCWNVGLALMVFVSVLPVGFLQLEVAFTEGYAAARAASRSLRGRSSRRCSGRGSRATACSSWEP